MSHVGALGDMFVDKDTILLLLIGPAHRRLLASFLDKNSPQKIHLRKKNKKLQCGVVGNLFELLRIFSQLI